LNNDKLEYVDIRSAHLLLLLHLYPSHPHDLGVEPSNELTVTTGGYSKEYTAYQNKKEERHLEAGNRIIEAFEEGNLQFIVFKDAIPHLILSTDHSNPVGYYFDKDNDDCWFSGMPGFHAYSGLDINDPGQEILVDKNQFSSWAGIKHKIHNFENWQKPAPPVIIFKKKKWICFTAIAEILQERFAIDCGDAPDHFADRVDAYLNYQKSFHGYAINILQARGDQITYILKSKNGINDSETYKDIFASDADRLFRTGVFDCTDNRLEHLREDWDKSHVFVRKGVVKKLKTEWLPTGSNKFDNCNGAGPRNLENLSGESLAEKEVEDWAANGVNPHRTAEAARNYLKEKYGISQRAVDRVWASKALPEWKVGGRKKKKN